jgi:hypothetical protein
MAPDQDRRREEIQDLADQVEQPAARLARLRADGTPSDLRVAEVSRH